MIAPAAIHRKAPPEFVRLLMVIAPRGANLRLLPIA